MLPEVEFRAADGTTYNLCFNARARYLFELSAGYPLHQLTAVRGTVSDVELSRIVVAGLEGHRVRTKARKAPWTLDEVLDDVLADLSPDERLRLLAVCLDGVRIAFATSESPEAATGAEGKAATTG